MFIVIGAANLEGAAYNLSHVGMSLGAFIAGCWTVGQIGHFVGVRKRLWLIASSAFQTALVYAAATIQYSLPTQQGSSEALTAIFFLAFSSGAQVALGRSLQITDITTAMATAAFADVAADSNLLKLENRPRNRRIIFLLMLITGCLVGAFSQAAINTTFAIVLCAICKTIATFTFLLNSPIENRS